MPFSRKSLLAALENDDLAAFNEIAQSASLEEINKPDEKGNNLVHYVATRYEYLKVLYEYGADLTSRTYIEFKEKVRDFDTDRIEKERAAERAEKLERKNTLIKARSFFLGEETETETETSTDEIIENDEYPEPSEAEYSDKGYDSDASPEPSEFGTSDKVYDDSETKEETEFAMLTPIEPAKPSYRVIKQTEKSLLHLACVKNVEVSDEEQKRAIKFILDRTGDRLLNLRDRDGLTPLMLAAASGNLSAAEILLSDKRVTKNNRDSLGRTELIHAAQNNHLGMVKLLLENGCDINQDSSVGSTLLHIAASDIERLDMLKYLLSKKPSNAMINNVMLTGGTALDIAKKFNNETACALLKAHHAKTLDELDEPHSSCFGQIISSFTRKGSTKST